MAGRVQVEDGAQMGVEAWESGRMGEIWRGETMCSRGYLTNADRNFYSMSVYIRFKHSPDSIPI